MKQKTPEQSRRYLTARPSQHPAAERCHVSPLKKITVLLADDHVVVRQGLCGLLEKEGHSQVVGQARNGREAVKMAQTLRPDVILMDIAMPVLGGIEATRQILAANPAAKVLFLSAHSDDEYIEHMTAIGAVGFLEKNTSTEILTNAVCEVAKGNLFFSPAIAKRMALTKKQMSMCSYCKKIRDDRNYWQQIESYINEKTGTEISHSVCPGCYQRVVIPELALLKKRALEVCTRTKIWPAGPTIVKFSEEPPDAPFSYDQVVFQREAQ